MPILEPEPLDPKRASKDLAYFAEKYLDIELTATQLAIVNAWVKKKEIVVNRHSEELRICAKVAIGFTRRQLIEVHEEKGIIDV